MARLLAELLGGAKIERSKAARIPPAIRESCILPRITQARETPREDNLEIDRRRRRVAKPGRIPRSRNHKINALPFLFVLSLSLSCLSRSQRVRNARARVRGRNDENLINQARETEQPRGRKDAPRRER